MRARRILALALAVLAISTLVMPVSAARGAPAQPYIVVLRDSAVARAGGSAARPRIDRQRVEQLVNAIAGRAGVTPANTFTSVFGGFSARLDGGQLRSIQSDPAVASVTAENPWPWNVAQSAHAEPPKALVRGAGLLSAFVSLVFLAAFVRGKREQAGGKLA